MYNRNPKGKKKEGMESSTDPNLSFRNIMKDVQFFASSHMTWKDKKALENKKVTALGGKPQKSQRLPLSVARVQMKKQKEREEKISENKKMLGRFGGLLDNGSTKKPAEKKRKPEDRVLKSTVGNFKSGVLDVRHLLHSGNDRDNKRSVLGKIKNLGGGEGGGGVKKKGTKKKGKNKGKKKGGGKRKK